MISHQVQPPTAHNQVPPQVPSQVQVHPQVTQPALQMAQAQPQPQYLQYQNGQLTLSPPLYSQAVQAN